MSNDNSRIFVAVGTDEYLTQFLDVIYDVATATPIFEHVHDARPGGSITPAMDYYILGGGYFGSVIGVLDIETGETVSQPTQHSYGGNIHEISADGQFLVFMTTSVSHCGGDYRQIFVYRLPSLELVISGGLPSMYGLGGNTADGRLNHDATLFVSVNNVYSTATAEIIAQIPSSHDLVFSSDGTRLILFRQGTIRIWGVVASPE
jgi:hypothetical protein